MTSWGPAAIWAAVLFLLSALPGANGPSWLPFSDKAAHLALYAVLGGTLAWARWASKSRMPSWAFVLLGLLYGVSDEWHQSFVPGRDPSAGDLLADGIGTLLGYLVLSRFLARRARGPAAFPASSTR